MPFLLFCKTVGERNPHRAIINISWLLLRR